MIYNEKHAPSSSNFGYLIPSCNSTITRTCCFQFRTSCIPAFQGSTLQPNNSDTSTTSNLRATTIGPPRRLIIPISRRIPFLKYLDLHRSTADSPFWLTYRTHKQSRIGYTYEQQSVHCGTLISQANKYHTQLWVTTPTYHHIKLVSC